MLQDLRLTQAILAHMTQAMASAAICAMATIIPPQIFPMAMSPTNLATVVMASNIPSSPIPVLVTRPAGQDVLAKAEAT